MTEGRDWTRVQDQACPDCGFDPSFLLDEELGPAVSREVAAWGRTLASADPAALRLRPEPDVWSALEYACHTRDVLPVMAARVEAMLAVDGAELGWWDHEAAVVERAYNDQDPVLVLADLGENGRVFSRALAGVAAQRWERTGVRRAGERFTLRGLARFVLHEVIHHRDDAERVLERVAAP